MGRHRHTSDQVFVVIQGSGMLELADQQVPLRAGTVVLIPGNTDHDTLVQPGQHIEYVYVNYEPR